MKAFVDWVVARRYRLILLAVVLAPLLPIATTALISLDTARRGPRQGMISAVVGIGVMVLMALPAGTSPTVSASLGAVTFLSGVGIGVLLERAGNLAFAFQAAMLLALLLVGGITLFGPDQQGLFEPVVRELAEVLRAGGATPQQVEVVEGWGGILLAAAVFSQLVGPLMLGFWWICVASGQKRFGVEFRSLKLGRLLGISATLIVLLGLVFDAPLVQNLTVLALLGFVLQGLAVLHAWAHAKRWHASLIAPVYVLLVTPLMLLVILALSAVGLMDNWYDLRASLRSQA